ncbi:General substrate transporter [Methylobacterium sp. 4-46]|uniref:MFS transporter n=1 Tax=unclassified Methylobacterium TaxID=2615210 RepID=UPI000152D7E3|nr:MULTISPECIES: MFS transporter [Methylobacterium]ACA20411.1 General substrate transporter [Methylobacterium sp. 4-46]WFT79580.1 MFS transporter [Methylobacterium nodulans]
MAHFAPEDRSRSKIATVLRVTSGNFLEMFDFFLFGFYATYISKAFFPTGNEYASLMLTFVTFGAGFLMRPLGAIFLGAYVDQVGRRQGLIVTLGIMAMGTILIAFVPSYATIGLLAPFLVLIGRLLQGFSAGVELGGVSVYLAEMATPGKKGFYVSWQSGSQQVAIMVSALIGYVLSQALTPEALGSWGWRIPFVIGCLIVPFLFYIRRSLEETEEFLHRKHRPTAREIFASLGRNWQIVLLGMLLVVMTTVSFYTITVYTPTFGKSVLKLSAEDSLLVTFCVAVSNFFWLPVMGALSDRVGRKPILLVFSALTLLTAYPALAWLVANTSFTNMLIVLLWLSFLYGSYNGAMVVALTEIVPASVRTAGFSLAYSLATALFGGFTPLVSTWLIEVTGNRAAPAFWLAFAGACGLVATLLIYRERSHAKGGSPGTLRWPDLPLTARDRRSSARAPAASATAPFSGRCGWPDLCPDGEDS